MRLLNEYVSAQGKLLRCGYTTGTCAAAAARAAADLLLANAAPPAVVVDTPAGIAVVVDVEHAERGVDWARCAVRKDAGDDPDVTDGVLVFAEVRASAVPGITIDGGEGVGRITKAGLDQGIGAAAINSTPRAMIREAVRDACEAHGHSGGLSVVISIPAGVELAERTFNPRLGIEGGISVLGTTGIVRPMSEDALVSSIELELRMLRAADVRHVLVVPGNYGKSFAAGEMSLSLEHAVACSNYLGATIDEALRLGFESMLLIGHVGKLAKVAAGAMNTHSRVADGRAETVAAHAALAGMSRSGIGAIMEAPTTDAMLEVVRGEQALDETMRTLMLGMERVLRRRATACLRVEAVMFSNAYGVLGMTSGARELLALHARKQEGERP